MCNALTLTIDKRDKRDKITKITKINGKILYHDIIRLKQIYRLFCFFPCRYPVLVSPGTVLYLPDPDTVLGKLRDMAGQHPAHFFRAFRDKDTIVDSLVDQLAGGPVKALCVVVCDDAYLFSFLVLAYSRRALCAFCPDRYENGYYPTSHSTLCFERYLYVCEGV